MKILEDSLEAVVERWDDPGDYPSNMGSGPLPSYNYVEAVEGEVVIELEPADLDEMDPERLMDRDTLVREWIAENSGEVEYDLPHGISISKWTIAKVEGMKATLTVDEFESEGVERPEPEWEPDLD